MLITPFPKEIPHIQFHKGKQVDGVEAGGNDNNPALIMTCFKFMRLPCLCKTAACKSRAKSNYCFSWINLIYLHSTLVKLMLIHDNTNCQNCLKLHKHFICNCRLKIYLKPQDTFHWANILTHYNRLAAFKWVKNFIWQFEIFYQKYCHTKLGASDILKNFWLDYH